MKIYSFEEGKIIKHKSIIEALNLDLRLDKIITVVGAGGKTSTIYSLAEELDFLGKKTIVTTTTHMRLEDDFILIDTDRELYKIESKLKNSNLVKLAKRESDYKVKSVDFDILRKTLNMAEFVLIEGDGSKNLPLKVPRDGEPVIIEETDLVLGIIGFDSLYKKIEDICHRKELVAEFLEKDLSDKIEVEDLLKIASSEKALKKSVKCKYKVIINKVDDEEDLKICREIDELFKKNNLEVVFTGGRY